MSVHLVKELTPPQISSDMPWRPLFALIRPLHWTKNLLLLAPLFLAHEFTHLDKARLAGWAVVAFSLAASAGYVVNDLLDLRSDRSHASKRSRPLAAGQMSVAVAVAVMLSLFAGSVLIAAVTLPRPFLMVMLGYLALSVSYSLVWKKLAIVDVMTLGALYTLRLVAGGLATGTLVSSWLMTFAVFFFASLAFVKRYVELDQTVLPSDATLQGRGYQPSDRQFLASTGPMCGAISVLVLALYLNSPAVTELYSWPHLLWLVLPLVFFWILRVWLLAQRGQLHEDPVVFAVTDWSSVAVVALAALLVIAAT